MAPLDRKLARDLWRIKGQAIAIGAVIAVGVLLQVMMTGLVASLEETRAAYYERYRLAGIFAPVARAPDRLQIDLRQIPGVAAVETRVTGSALVDLSGRDVPIQARAVSLPDFGDPGLNGIFLTDGRMFAGDRADEVVLLNSFARAHGLRPGDTINATMNGFRRGFSVVGLAQAPEFLVSTAPGDMVSEDGKYAVIWMSRTALGAAFDMKGAFNEALVALTRDAHPQAVIDAIDLVLDRYGGSGAYGIEDMTSNRYITEEIGELRSTSTSVPPVFLAVAAYLLYIVISRLVQAERGQIGLLKAFGYTDPEVGWHYFKLILSIAVGGALAGGLLGIAAGRAMVELYLVYFKFPFLIFRVEPSSFLIGFGTSILSASAGGVVVLRRVFSLTPADAMQAEAPEDFSRARRMGPFLARLLDQPSRMVLRRLTRQPWRMMGAISGVAAGVALSAAMTSVLNSFDDMMDLSFNVLDRSDVMMSFIHPIEARSVFDLESLPGVIEVEPVRVVGAILRNGRDDYRGYVNGLAPDARLFRALDSDRRDIFLREDGIILSTGLAQTLSIGAGEVLRLDIREGRQPVVEVPVMGVAESLMGAPAYMDLAALNRLLGEPLRVSGAYLRVDADRQAAIYRALKDMPMVAGVSVKAENRASMQKLMDQGAGGMRYVMALIAAVITFGVIYNAARVALAERAHDLASLRVLGFSRAEVSFVLLGELGVVVLLALPLGGVLGYGLAHAISAGFSTDLYQVPAHFDAASYGTAIAVVLMAALISGWLVKRDIYRTEMVEALKTRE